MAHRRPLSRFFRHLATDHVDVRRALPAAALARIEALIADGEKRHRGQLRFAIEPALPIVRLWRGVTPRERAIEAFGLMRIWDTEENSGVLVYLLLADRDVEIVADRGIHRCVGATAWEEVCRKMESAFGDGRYVEGVEAGLADINALLARHYPRAEGSGGNELPDQPVVL